MSTDRKWFASLSAFAHCGQAHERQTLEALQAFRDRRCPAQAAPPSAPASAPPWALERACGEAAELLRRFGGGGGGGAALWTVLGDSEAAVAALKGQIRALDAQGGRVVAAAAEDESLRGHSGLASGGGGGGTRDRAARGALGPLVELLAAEGSLSLVGTAGSSFSEALAALAGHKQTTAAADGKPPARPGALAAGSSVRAAPAGAGPALALIRTPFIKSYQVITR